MSHRKLREIEFIETGYQWYLNHSTDIVMRNSCVILWTHANGIRGPHIDAWTADPEVSSPSCWRVFFMLHVTHDRTFIRETNIVCAWPGLQVSYIPTTIYIHLANFILYDRSIFIQLLSIIIKKALQNISRRKLIFRKIIFYKIIFSRNSIFTMLALIWYRRVEKCAHVYFSLFTRKFSVCSQHQSLFVSQNSPTWHDEWVGNLSEHKRRPTSPTWPDVNARSRVLKTDPKHTTRQWSIIISFRPPLHTGECGQVRNSFLLGGYKIWTVGQP